MNKERFHNEIAMRLGYERIVRDKRISIEIEESDDPWVTLKIEGCPEIVRFKASDPSNGLDLKDIPAMQDEIMYIADATHQAYIESTNIILHPYIRRYG